METLYKTLELLLSIAWFFVLAHVIMSWLINFQVLNLRQPLVFQLWSGLNQLLNPLYSRVRRFLPDTGALDLAPLVVFVAIIILGFALEDNKAVFY